MKLCDDKLFSFLVDLLKPHPPATLSQSVSPALIASVAYVCGCLMSGNYQGQNMAREKRMLHTLIAVFKYVNKINHTHTHTHTHKHTHTHIHIRTCLYTHSHTLSLSHTHTHTCTLLSPSCFLIRSTLPKSPAHSKPEGPGQHSDPATANSDSVASLQVWTSVSSALCTANNNPQNGMSVNQMDFCEALME